MFNGSGVCTPVAAGVCTPTGPLLRAQDGENISSSSLIITSSPLSRRGMGVAFVAVVGCAPGVSS